MKSSMDRVRMAGGFAALLILCGCSGGSSLFGKSDSNSPHDYGLVRDWNLSGKDQPKSHVVQASDLVGPDGRCADEVPGGALHFQAGPDASRSPAPSAAAPLPAPSSGPRSIGLGTTECDVVKAAGHTDRVEISSNEAGGRRVVLSYSRGDHDDVYQFEDGRLRSIQRIPQMQAAQKPSKPKRSDTRPVGN